MKNIEWKNNSLKISDLLYKEALGVFTQVQGRLAHGFSSLDEYRNVLLDECLNRKRYASGREGYCRCGLRLGRE